MSELRVDSIKTADGARNLVPYEHLETLLTTSGLTGELTAFDNSKYNSYKLLFNNVVPDANDILAMRLSDDGGASYPTTGYSWSSFFTEQAGTSSVSASNSDDAVKPCAGQNVLPSGSGICGWMTMHNLDPDLHTYLIFNTAFIRSTGSSFMNVTGSGRRSAAASIDALQFYWDGGADFDGGSVDLYGLAI